VVTAIPYGKLCYATAVIEVDLKETFKTLTLFVSFLNNSAWLVIHKTLRSLTISAGWNQISVLTFFIFYLTCYISTLQQEGEGSQEDFREFL
jgi:hypothetical protein